LEILLLGPFQATLDGKSVVGPRSTKVGALLAYLAAEAARPHHRDGLVGLLWPHRPTAKARSNLRYTLADLRSALGDHQDNPPFLHTDHNSIQLNQASNHWLDVTAFESLLAVRAASGDQAKIDRFLRAVDLYRGSFLEGFSAASSAFDEWVLLKREHFARQVAAVLRHLAALYEQRGEYTLAEDYARRELELEPWNEESHRQLMRLLALTGRRSAALAQYEACRRMLESELGVEPEPLTAALYRSIRDGILEGEAWEHELRRRVLSPTPPRRKVVDRFVGRESELAQLEQFLTTALAGEGQVVFVTGDAGSGKTSLVEAFVRRELARHGNLVVAQGSCSAHLGIGDALQPLRQILQLLGGGIEQRRESGTITVEQACRLWAVLPATARALLEAGPDLIDRFVSGAVLAQHLESWAPQGPARHTQLLAALRSKRTRGTDPRLLEQADLFSQVTAVWRSLARQYPMIVVVEDLHWADDASASLLFHLGRHLSGIRILLIGTYRPAMVASGREGKRHPLEAVVNECRRRFGDIEINLDCADGRYFVESLMGSMRHRLLPSFSEVLYQHTGGHALFTVELLRDMQEEGDLVQDEAGRWIEGQELNWERLPARVEAVIAERLGRLPAELHKMLVVASVEGDEFTAEVVARVLALMEGEVIQQLSGPLSEQQHLVRSQRIMRPQGQRLSIYRFRHSLFQKYLYNHLDEVERRHLHEVVGEAIEVVWGSRKDEVAVRLAYHFEAAGLPEKAADYFLLAGNRAVQVCASQEAIALFNRGLALLENLPESPQRLQGQVRLQLALAAPLSAVYGKGSPERVQAVARSIALSKQGGETGQRLLALFLLADLYRAQSRHQESIAIGEQLLQLAEQAQEFPYQGLAHWTIGESLFFCGALGPARANLEQAIVLCDPQADKTLTYLTGTDMGVTCLAMLAYNLWGLGYPDQSLRRAEQALSLARTLEHPMPLALALAVAGSGFHLLRREDEAAWERIEELLRLSEEKELPFFLAWGTVHHGWWQVRQGEVEEGMARIRQGMEAWRAMGMETVRPHHLVVLAEAYGLVGRIEEGLQLLNQAARLVEQTGSHYYGLEICWQRGVLLQSQDPAAAEVCFRRGITLAQQQQAHSWELRAALGLGRLLQRQGHSEEARQLLAEIYDWFSEGFDTPDLQDARALLEELGGV
jgi:DNA-binding SARP family transcriptional activator